MFGFGFNYDINKILKLHASTLPLSLVCREFFKPLAPLRRFYANFGFFHYYNIFLYLVLSLLLGEIGDDNIYMQSNLSLQTLDLPDLYLYNTDIRFRPFAVLEKFNHFVFPA